jgi:hypothetical protein
MGRPRSKSSVAIKSSDHNLPNGAWCLPRALLLFLLLCHSPRRRESAACGYGWEKYLGVILTYLLFRCIFET